MRNILMAIVFFAVSKLCLAVEYGDCSAIDEDLVSCPIVEAPLRTGLREVYVLVRYTVLKNGSVEGIEVVESDPPGMWDRAVTRALVRWQFKPQSAAVEKEWHFVARFSE